MSKWKPNCDFFFEDYFRGREKQECRLLERSRGPHGQWNIGLCRTCPVPKILQANRCPNIVLEARIETRLFRRRVQVAAFCTHSMREVEQPMIGCGECHHFREVYT